MQSGFLIFCKVLGSASRHKSTVLTFSLIFIKGADREGLLWVLLKHLCPYFVVDNVIVGLIWWECSLQFLYLGSGMDRLKPVGDFGDCTWPGVSAQLGLHLEAYQRTGPPEKSCCWLGSAVSSYRKKSD